MKNFRSFVTESDKEAYKKFFDAKLKKYGVNSPEDLSDADKKKFFNEIDKEWNSDDEDGKDGMKEYIKQDGARRRCSGGDGRKNKKIMPEEDEVEEGKDQMYSESQINKACKATKMSPGEIGSFYAALEGK
tara:strand:- start:150 stop:542 length:393 start_codon:yes stop_codon:yes gene_type:complete